MYAILHEFVCSSKEFCGNDDNGSCTITDFFILLLCEVDENLASRVFDVEEGENGCAIVCNCDILDGWISIRIVLVAELVNAHTPISSTIILSRPLGPKELFTTLAIACVARTVLN